MTNDSQPSTSALNSALSDFVAGQFTAGSWRAAARALVFENCGDFVSGLSAAASLLASSMKATFFYKPLIYFTFGSPTTAK
jgi:hypothetical protein